MEKVEEFLKKMEEKDEQREYNKSRANVGIFPEQVERIKKLVMERKYKSINHFVIQVVEENLNKMEKKE